MVVGKSVKKKVDVEVTNSVFFPINNLMTNLINESIVGQINVSIETPLWFAVWSRVIKLWR